MFMKCYVHYGADQYNKDLVEIRKSWTIPAKPDKGLWASPLDADYGWKDWCQGEDFRLETLDASFKFVIKDSANILHVHSEKDILPYVIPCEYRFCITETSSLDKLDQELLYSKFDGIELHLSDNYSMHNGIFNTWDCDSICVWNPDVIIPLEK